MTVPVTLLSGFLGSGKTTILNQALRSPLFNRTAVIVNELGEVPLDHFLIREVSPNVLLLESGCICCGLQSDLVETLVDLESKLGRFPRDANSFDRVVIETTGVADPAPILATLLRHPALVEQYHAATIISTFDCDLGEDNLRRFEQAERQLALADLVVMTKTDLVAPDRVFELQKLIARINPNAPLHESGHRAIDLGALVAMTRRDSVLSWSTDTFRAAKHLTKSIRSLSVRCEQSIQLNDFFAWFSTITQLYGNVVLRVKGLLNVEGEPGPLVVQSVRHVVYPPYSMDAWPSEDTSSRLTVLTCDMDAALLEAFEASLGRLFKTPFG